MLIENGVARWQVAYPLTFELLQHRFARGHSGERVAADAFSAVEHCDDCVERGCVHAFILAQNAPDLNVLWRKSRGMPE